MKKGNGKGITRFLDFTAMGHHRIEEKVLRYITNMCSKGWNLLGKTQVPMKRE